ncbi:MAG: aspartate-semialdehyde dehydrogenase [Spirochaetota bacterium]|nr:aspartate-semialdehyde dehydrogenase [Spirochaetota bacterium]
MKKYNLVILGATGAVGIEFRKILLERNFPINNVRFLGSSSVGKIIEFGDRKIEVEPVTDDSFKGYDIALFSAGGEISKKVARKAADSGCIVIDNSSAWRMEKDIPLIVPEVNPQDVNWHNGIIANPNCSTIQMVLPLKHIHDAARIKRIVVSTYQAVSGTGINAIDELTIQTKKILEGGKASIEVYPHQIAFNALPSIDVFLSNGYSKEEMKMVNETKKILGDDSIQITATAVRIPVFYSHSESVNIETEIKITSGDVKELLHNKEGITVVDDPSSHLYPLAINAQGKDNVFVGRIRDDESIPKGINMWIVSDNIRKGAALNTIQIAELLISKNMIMN